MPGAQRPPGFGHPGHAPTGGSTGGCFPRAHNPQTGLHGRSHRPRGSQRRCAERSDYTEHRWRRWGIPRRDRRGLGGHSVGAPNASTTPNTVGHDGRHLDQAQAGAPADRPPGPRRSAAGLGDSPPSGAGGPRTRTLSTTTDGEGASQTRKRRALEFPRLRGWGIQPTEARVFHRARRVQDAKLLPYEPGLHSGAVPVKGPSEGFGPPERTTVAA